MITFTPLSSSSRIASTSTAATPPLAYLIELDEIKILVDCGSPDLRKALEGTDEEGEYEKLLREHAPTISLLLLTHSSLPHLGYYPFARSQLNLTCPVYATVPVASMGRVSCIEEAQEWRSEMDGSKWEEDIIDDEDAELNEGGQGGMEVDPADADATELVDGKVVSGTGVVAKKGKGEVGVGAGGGKKKKTRRTKWVATGEEVVEAFEAITRVKFESPTRLMGALSSLTITAFSSGHTLGGTIWKIRSPSSGTVLHAVGMNHTKERHLDGTALLKEKGEGVHEGLGRPDLLITDTDRVGWKNVKRRERDGALLDLITKTLTSQSSLLFPVDPSTRLIELLILLDQHWSYSMIQSQRQGRNWIYPLCLVSKTGKQMIDFARSLMEWMGGGVASGEAAGDGGVGRNNGRGGGGGGETRGHPLEFRHLRFYDSVEALTATYPASRPKLVLAIPPSMSHGPSRSLFTQYATSPQTLLVLTSRGVPGTLAGDMFEKWNALQERGGKAGEGGVGKPVEMKEKMEIQINLKVPLSGQELADHLESKRLLAEKDLAQKTARVRTRKLLEADEVDSDDDDSDDSNSDGGMDGVEGEDGEPAPRRGGPGVGVDGGGWEEGGQKVSFDIYVKGQTTRATTFFKSATNQAPRFRMFPVGMEKRGRKVDVYGETIDVGVWLRKGKEIEEEGESEVVKAAKRRKIEEEEKAEEPPEPPSKFVVENHSIQLRCGLYYTDMEGLNDGRAIKTIIPQVNPRRLILVQGTASATDELIATFKAIPSMTTEIFAPDKGEALQIGENLHSYPLSLGDGLMAGLKFSKFEDYEVAQITGRYTFPSNSTIPILELASSTQLQQQPTSSTSSLSQASSLLNSLLITLPPLPSSLFIGDLKLTALKSRLQKIGIAAEFAGEGVLVCGVAEELEGEDGEVVAVKKMEGGRIEVEGGTGDIYYRVRKEVYGLHAMVEG